MNNGIVIVDKPKGITSHDVVNRLRKVYKTKRVGHTGTLDPGATGVLPICIGQTTRLAEYLTAEDKQYKVRMVFGEERDTQDKDGSLLFKKPLPTLTRSEFEQLTKSFIGELIQEIPMYSAVKINGRPLYQLARQGIQLENIPQRKIRINNIECLSYHQNYAELRISCGKGTYIRTLCVDIGKAANSAAYIDVLRRESVGHFKLIDAVPLQVLEESKEPLSFLLSPLEAMKNYPDIILGHASVEKIKNGRYIPLSGNAVDSPVVKAVFCDQLLAVGEIKDNVFYPKKVFVNRG